MPDVVKDVAHAYDQISYQNCSMKNCLVFAFILLLSVSLISHQEVEARDIYRTHSVSAQERIFSYNIPIIGTLIVDMRYIVDLEIRLPDSIVAGESETIQISPSNARLVTTFSLGGEEIPISRDINLGSLGRIEIPFTVVGEVIVVPSLVTTPSASGQAYVSQEWINLDSMSTKRFDITVEDYFDNYSTRLDLPMAIILDVGGNINLIITDVDLREYIGEKIAFNAFPTFSENIKVIKYRNTYLSLDITDDSNGNVKIKPILKNQEGQILTNYSITISVDGQYKTTINSNQWSGNIKSSSGPHNFQASFSETTDRSDDSIIYKSSSVTERFTVKSPSQPTPTKSISTLPCGKGTHVENGQCVADPLFGGCLIATATFGSELAPQVQQLREIRDNSLLQTNSGSAFMTGFNELYYSFSPTIADWERENPLFKETVKLTITPLITSLSILNYVDIDSEAEVLGYGISLILLNIGMYFVAPALVVIRIFKTKGIKLSHKRSGSDF